MAADYSNSSGQLAVMVRRHLRLLIVLAVLGAAIGAGLVLVLPAKYSATASVLVTPLEGNPYSPTGRGDDLVNLETEAQLVGTDAVARIAQGKLRGGEVGRLRSQVSASVPPNTQVVNITYTTDSARGAEQGARVFAESYLEYRRQRAQSVLDGKLKKLQEQSARVEANLRNATQQLASATGTQRTYLARRITAYTNQLGVIDEQTNDINSTAVSPGQVINPASVPSTTKIMRLVLFSVGGLLTGLAGGLAIAVALHRVDRRLHDPAQVQALGMRILSVIPDEPVGTDTSLVLVDSPKSPAGEAYRRLRSGVVANISETPVSLLVASADPGGTAAVTAANLAMALAFAGSRTIMIDATASGVDSAALFGVQPGKGLSDTLLTGTDPASLLIHADPQLQLLPRGGDAPAAMHRFSGPRMRNAVETLGRRADFLLVNAPSVHDADAQALCTLIDAVILVVHRGVTTREHLQQAHTEVVHAGAEVLGVVVEPGTPRAGRAVRSAAPARPPAAGKHGAAPASTASADVPRPRGKRAAPHSNGYDWSGDAESVRINPQGSPQSKAQSPPRRPAPPIPRSAPPLPLKETDDQTVTMKKVGPANGEGAR